MGMMLPIRPEFSNEAEEKVFEYFKQNLSVGWIGYFNYEILGSEPDFILVSPDGYVYIVEVKGYSSLYKIRVVDNQSLIYHGRRYQSALKQAKRYFSEMSILFKELKLDAFIFPIVCYPNLSKKDWLDVKLEVHSKAFETILKDDFEKNHVIGKLNSCFEAQKNKGAKYRKFDSKERYRFRAYFETDDTLKINEEIIEVKDLELERIFSKILVFSFIESIDFKKLEDDWKRGIKLYLFLSNGLDYDEFIAKFIDQLSKGSFLYQKLIDIKKQEIFNVEINRLSIKLKSKEIKDEEYLLNIDTIKVLACNSKFNIQQFNIVHESLENDILVSAGAGTGKTYSMVNRIAYICNKKNVTIDELPNTIAMVTFTNEAAKNMKKRIRAYYEKLYVLTGQYKYLQLSDSVDLIQISTIHSFLKHILEEISYAIDMAGSIKIVTNKYDYQVLLAKLIDQSSSKFKQFIQDNMIKQYQIIDVMIQTISGIKQKNIKLIDLEKKCEVESMRNDNGEFLKEYLQICAIADRIIQENNTESGSINLSDLQIKLIDIMSSNELYSVENCINYLFVDEFQDTDDVQIELLLAIRKAFRSKLFIVGDVKQCIYRFRGAEDQAFAKVIGQLEDISTHSLKYNYRSEKKVIDRINEWCLRKAKVNLLPFNENDIMLNVFDDTVSRLQTIEYDKDNFDDKVLAVIQQFCRDNSVENAAVLTRTNSQCKKIETILIDNGIDAITQQAKLFYNSEPVIEFYKLIKAITGNKDFSSLLLLLKTSYASLIKHDFKFIDDIVAVQLVQNGQSNTWQKYMKDFKNEPTIKVISKLIYNFKPWDHYASKFDNNLTEYKREYYKNSIEILLEILLEENDSDYLSLSQIENKLKLRILTHAEVDNEALLSNEYSNNNPIHILTVHKAKGLEFDEVILPFVETGKTRKKTRRMVELITKKVRSEWEIGINIQFENITIKNELFDKNLEYESDAQEKEEERINYVAFTRTIKKLIMYKRAKKQS